MICRSPVKRGRKALAVSEGHIDVTGRTHIMTNDEFIDVLSERLDKLESLTQKIVDATKSNDQIVPETAVNFSTMEIDDLIKFSNNLLFKKADIPSIPNQILMPQTACPEYFSFDWQIGSFGEHF
ncbi:13781_t:CDS:2 [Dentiscutata erythropus]|uniref:13781_t:CDS:1 n=1 Tax=Dentiscutata erythropus TaxID=1348616 RepID=A0A9N9GQR4_9GLOM|nr:13781_t:CDS:2 [Dentiscutata erythropus]